MAEPSDAVDSYLEARFRIGLEQVLLDATGGYVTTPAAAIADVVSGRFDSRRHPDGGISEGYAGTLTIEGVTYEFRCWVYLDIDGGRYLSDLSEFSPTGWQASIRLGTGNR